MINVNLTSRQKQILWLLNARQTVYSGKELSSAMGISDRTLRTDITQINRQLEKYGIKIEAVHSKGYLLSVQNPKNLLELFATMENYQTKEDRILSLILRLLAKVGWQNLGELEDEIHVSHATMEKDIKSIRHRYSQQYPYLKIERKGDQIRIEDDEKKKRSILIRTYVENWDYDSKEGIILLKDDFKSGQLAKIQELLNEQLTQTDTYLDDYAFVYLTMTVVVMYLRNRSGFTIEDMSEPVESVVPAPASFLQAQLGAARITEPAGEIDASMQILLQEMERIWEIQFSKSEYRYLSEIKQQLVFLCEKNTQRDFIFLSRTDETSRAIVDELREALNAQYGIDFSEDDMLYVGLTRHVQGIRTGMMTPPRPNRVLGEELRKKYPFLGEMVHFMRRFLEERCEMSLGSQEENYLLPPMILAESALYQKRRGSGIPTAVISHFNDSTTMCLMNQLKQHYGAILDLYGPFTLHERNLIDQKNASLIVSTVRADALYQAFRVPVLKVSPLLDAADQIGIDLYLYSLKNRYLYQAPLLPMADYFPNSLCYRLTNKNNILPLLAEIKERLEKETGYPCPSKINMESDYFCVLTNGFLFYYQINNRLAQSVVSLVDLGKETSCRYARNIRTVMYMQMPQSMRPTLGWFYYIAMELAQYPEELKAVFSGKSLEDLTINISRNTTENFR